MLSESLFRALLCFVIVWFIIDAAVTFSQRDIMDYQYAGFPWKYKEGGGMCVGGPCGDVYDHLNLAGDIAVWFVVAWVIASLSGGKPDPAQRPVRKKG